MSRNKQGGCGCPTPNTKQKTVPVKPHKRGKPRDC
jgi:hypothetical protein